LEEAKAEKDRKAAAKVFGYYLVFSLIGYL